MRASSKRLSRGWAQLNKADVARARRPVACINAKRNSIRSAAATRHRRDAESRNEVLGSELDVPSVRFLLHVCSCVDATGCALVMVALCNRADHYIFALLFLSSIFFFSSPNLSDRRLDVYHTLTHGVAQCEFRMQVWKVLHAARCKCRTQKVAKITIWAPSYNFVGLYLRNWGIYRQSEKNLLSSNISCTCPHNMVNLAH